MPAGKAARRAGGGALKQYIASGVVLALLGGGGLAWANINSISSLDGVYGYFKGVSDKFQQCTENVDEGQISCTLGIFTGGGGDTQGNAPQGGSAAPAKPGQGLEATLKDKLPNGTVLPAGAQVPKENLLQALEAVPTKPSQKVNYKRSEWKHWIGKPCNTRERVLIAQGKNVKPGQVGDDCGAKTGQWTSPYDDKEFTQASELDIDHVIPLSWAAQNGGNNWDPATKQKFANDMTQLLATSAEENRGKGDKGPSEYMPDHKSGFRCHYSKIWVSTLSKYGLSVPKEDKDILRRELNRCGN